MSGQIKKIISHKTKDKHQAKRLVFTGFSMGIADLVPGVSGGTIALLYGIYDELIYSIKLVTGEVPKLILKGKINKAFNVIPWGFLLPLFIGIFLAIFSLVRVFSFLLDSYPIYVWSLFFGLVLCSSYIVSLRVSKWNINRSLLLIGGFLATFIVVGIAGSSQESGSIAFLITGAIASSAMILPGISGSLIMVLLGQYENVINAVKDFDVLLISIFIVGAVFGLALLSRILSWLLKNYHAATIALLVGVMLGSLRKIWPWQLDTTNKSSLNTYMPELSIESLSAVILMIIGSVLVWKLSKMGIAKEHVDIGDKKFKQEIKSQNN